MDSSGRLNRDGSGIDSGDGASPRDLGASDGRSDGHADGDGATDRTTLAHLFVDSTSHDFGLIPVNTASAGGTFTVKNDGGGTSDPLSVVLDGASVGFSLISDECSGNPLAAGASCRIVVVFSPTVAGKQQGSVTFHATDFDASATVLGEGITSGTLAIDPTAQPFGLVVMPASSSDQTFTVTNTGEGSSGTIATALVGTDAANFAITADGCKGHILAYQQSCQMTARFVPTSLGDKSVSLQASADPGGSAVAQLSGSSITRSAVVLSPSSFDFGSVQQGLPGISKQFTAQNAGQATTTTLLPAMSTSDFTITGDTCSGQVLAANAICTLTVQFAPATPGSKLATLSLAELGGGTATAQVTGTSLANPALRLSPATNNFNSVTVGSSATVTFQVSNDGDVASSVPSVTIGGVDVAQFSIPTGSNGCTAAIPAKGSCMIGVRFAPTSTGAKAASLTVSATAGGTTTATLAGTGLSPGVLSLNLPSFDFRGVEQGTVSPVATFTVTNSGQSTTGLITANIVGSAVFAIVTNGCNMMMLAPATSCSLTVHFAPTAPGPVSSTLQIAAAGGSTATVSLTGTGLASASLVTTPTAFTFSGTLVGATSANQTFTVTNTGGVSAGSGTALAAVLGGANASDFTIVTSNCAGALPGGSTCMVVVAFAPKSAGNKTASLSVSATPGGAAVAAFSGTAQNSARLAVTVASGSSAAFGNVQVGSTSDKTFIVNNTGDQTSSAIGLTLSSAAGSGFTLLAPATGECMSGVTTLVGGGSCSVRVRFAPTVAGTQSATLGASATTGGAASLGLTGGGQRMAALTGTNSNNYGTMVIGNTSGTANWTIVNNGDVATGTPTLINSNTVEVLVTSNNCTAPLAGGGTCVIGVAFRPSGSGSRTGTLTLSATPGGSVTFTATADGQAAAGLALAPATGSSTNFGNVLVGSNVVETYTLTNTGQQPTTAVTLALTTTTGSGFALVAPTTGECVSGTTILAGGAACTIRVRFTAAAAGAQTATLAATATTGGTATPLPLTGNGQRPAALSGTTTNNFGTVVVAATSATFTWTISNTGDVATGVPALTNSNQTELIVGTNTCTVAVAGGGKCTIGASFRPSAAGARTGTLTLTATPGGTVTLTASATGQTAAGLALAPATGSSASFGNVLVGATGTQTFVLTNTGQQTTTALTVTLTTAASSGFAVVAPTTGDCTTGSTTLAGGATCTIHVKFTAPGAGLQTATLGASATTGGAANTLSLSGNGQRPALLSGTTTNNFGTVVVGATSGAFTWTISNTGDAATGVPALTNGTAAELIVGANNCTAAIPGGGQCTISVSFRPAASGARSGTLSLAASPGGTVTLTASATGQTAAGLVLAAASGSSTSFGNVLLGSAATRAYVLTNAGQQATTAVTVSLTTAATSGFALAPVAGDCPSTPAPLAGGASCTIHVQFTAPAPGLQTATLGATASVGGTAPGLSLSGNGQRPALLTGTSSNNFGTVVVGATSGGVTWTVTNGGDVPTGVPALTNGDTGEVLVSGNTCTAALAAGASCTIAVSFSAAAAGARSGMLTLAATPGGLVTFTASANGQTAAGLALAPAAGSSTSFGNVLVGAAVTQSFVLTNTGQQATGAVAVTLTTAATSGFALVPPVTGDCPSTAAPLAGGASCTIHVKFTAPGAGLQMASLGASAAVGGTAASLSLSGTGQRPASLTGMTSNNFGTLVVGATSGSVTWIVTNSGDVPTGTPSLNNGDPGEVLVASNNCTVALAGGASCSIVLSFSPAQPGARSGTLALAAAPGGTLTFTASATGQTQAALALAPATGFSTSFGNVLVGSTVTQTFVLTNTGQQTATATTVSLSAAAGFGFALVPPGAGDCPTAPSSLAGGASCTIQVSFTAPGSGLQTTSLSASAAVGGTATPLSLSGTGQRPALLTGMTSNDFGTLVVGAPGGTVTWTVINSGDLPTGAPALSNGDLGEILVGQNTCTTALAGGASCTIQVSFTPAAAGARSGMLTLAATPGGSVTFTASSTALTPAALTVAPDMGFSTDFGMLPIGMTLEQAFIVTNTGQQTSTPIAVTLAAPDADFTIVPTDGDCVSGVTALIQGQTCLVHVQFQPSLAVPSTASLEVSATAGGFPSIMLTGQGQ